MIDKVWVGSDMFGHVNPRYARLGQVVWLGYVRPYARLAMLGFIRIFQAMLGYVRPG